MWQGINVAASLLTETKRCSERAAGSFFARQYPAFVLDAGLVVEYLAKYLIADQNPLDLYSGSARRRITPHMEAVLSHPRTSNELTMNERGVALEQLSKVNTITGKVAVEVLNGPNFLDGDIYVEGATRLREARNMGMHLGEFPQEVPSSLATDLIAVVDSMTARRTHLRRELWGIFPDVVTRDHLCAPRSATAEAEIRICRARWAWLHAPGAVHRLSSFQISGSRTMKCPVCTNIAGLSTTVGEQTPEFCTETHERGQQVDVLDCLHCGITLYGGQIAAAVARQSRESSTVFETEYDWLLR